tara:strand:+ start:1344 stop:1571 length:228 start_codon:yes stop_codon:yes gene_type:complete
MDSTKKTKSKSKRCSFEGCNKKLTILDVPCKCKLIFCKNHKFFTNHNCSYDYKNDYKKLLIKNNPKVVCKSIEVI